MARGKPFEKGNDPRRNAGGQRNKAAVAFSRSLRELIVKEGEKTLTLDGKKHRKVELLIRKVWTEALSGKEWAVNFIAERTEGKVKEEFEHTINGAMDVRAIDYGVSITALAPRPMDNRESSGEA